MSNEHIHAETTAPEIHANTRLACEIAMGREPADPGASGMEIVGAKKDLNAKGNGPEWHRMVYRNGSWRYVSDDRLPTGKFLASDRRATIHGEVYPGEIVVAHDRGAQVDLAWIIRTPNEPDHKGCMVKIEFRSRRDGMLAFTLPTGEEVVLVNPRKR